MRRLGSAGFGALEVLVSLTLFSIAATALLRATVGTTRGNTASKNSAVATTLIYDKVEQFRSYESGVSPDLAPGYHEDAGGLSATGQAGGPFHRSWTVFADVPRHGVARVDVTVSWTDPVARSLNATTYVCRTPTCS